MGAELLYSAKIGVATGDEGMLDLSLTGRREVLQGVRAVADHLADPADVAGEPVYLILAYGVLGAFFMPFLAVTLLWMLNTDRTPAQWRTNPASNVALAICTLAFAALAVNETREPITTLVT